MVASANASSAREGTYSLAGTESSQQPASAGSGSFFARLFGRGEDKKQDPAPQPAAAASAPKAAPAPARATATAAAKPAPKPEPQREARSQSPQPQQEARSQTPQAQPAPPAPQRAEPKAAAFSDANTVMPGAQPVVPAGFESRWSAVR